MAEPAESLFPDAPEVPDARAATGIVPSQGLRQLIRKKAIWAEREIPEAQIQPASLDLRLGAVGYRIRASFLPGPGATVREKIDAFAMHEIDLTEGTVLEKGCAYIVRLQEHLHLTRGLAGVANPKSSIGRLDVFTRVITDYAMEFDTIAPGYKGPLYAEIAPLAFSVVVRQGSRLGQLRLKRGSPALSNAALRALYRRMHPPRPDTPGGAGQIEESLGGVGQINESDTPDGVGQTKESLGGAGFINESSTPDGAGQINESGQFGTSLGEEDAEDAKTYRGGFPISVDLSGAAGGMDEGDGPQPIGWKARRHAPLVDVDAKDQYDPLDFWEPVWPQNEKGESGNGIILDPNDFYILASREAIGVPPDMAAEMVAYDTMVGEFRVHYAGFFDPGFGYGDAGGESAGGTRAVLEVRAHEVPFMVEHGQIVGRLIYEKLASLPDKLYGQDIGSSYQRQGLKLGKQFKAVG